MKSAEMARFDARITKEQKEFFEYAASLGGFRTLTEFFVFSANEKAKKIVEEHTAILSSKKDQQIFFDSMIHPPKANARLKRAAKRYKDVTE